MIRVHLFHDLRLVREALANALNYEPELDVLGASTDDWSRLYARTDVSPKVIIIGSPGEDPALWVDRHRQVVPGVKVLLLRTPNDRECPRESSGADAELDPADGLNALADIVRRLASRRS